MISLDEYLYNNHVKELENVNIHIIKLYEYFGYEDDKLFEIDLNFFIKLYNLKLVDEKNTRLHQNIFRSSLIKRDKQCIISKTDCEQCEAAHIIPLSENNNYELDNGILLSSNLHKLFDKYYWSINPETQLVEINKKLINGRSFDCNIYDGYKVNININLKMRSNLINHYNKFKEIF